MSAAMACMLPPRRSRNWQRGTIGEMCGDDLDRETEDMQTPSPHIFGVASAAFKNFIDSA